ncbi:O116 family O-antigen flippase, partial [Escherichia coli]|nr:O116 family O-antigen flippase [Escherichia coli]
MAELKYKTINSLKWSALERIFSQGIQLILMLVLARLLGPKAFGLIGMLAIFIAIGQVFIDSGFSSALIRKNDRTHIDYTTAFYFNVTVAILFYVVLFFSAPLIAKFYHQPELELLSKIIGLSLITNSFCVVPRTILTIAMDFKSQAKVSVLSVVLGGAFALFLAWKGFGVWSLVAQTLTVSMCNALLLNIITKWIPGLFFSKKSFLYLFGFGGKLLISGLLDTIYNNMYQIIIGKKFSAANVGQYTQANQISSIPAMTLTNIIQRVTYPMFSHMQDDEDKLKKNYLLTLKLAALFIFPIMAGIGIIAQPLFFIILGPQWIDASRLIIILSFAYMIYPIHAVNLNILQVKGRSDLFLQLEIMKKLIGVIVILITMNYGIYGMCFGLVFHSYLCLIVNTYYTKKMTKLTLKQQMIELGPVWIITIISCAIAYIGALHISDDALLQVLLMVVIAVALYIGLIFLLQRNLLK